MGVEKLFSNPKGFLLFNKHHAELIGYSAKEALKLGSGSFSQDIDNVKILHTWEAVEGSKGRIYIHLSLVSKKSN